MLLRSSEVQDGAVIAVDLDNVICDTDPKIREIIRKISGVSLSQDEITNYAYSTALINRGVESSEAKQIVKEAAEIFHDSECLNVGPLDGALEGIYRFLDAGLKIVIPTSRPDRCQKNTESWLSSFDVPYHELLFLEDKTRNARSWSYLIEDAMHHAYAVCEAGTPVCLLDYPWNRATSSCQFIYRAKDWNEIVNIVMQMTLPRRK